MKVQTVPLYRDVQHLPVALRNYTVRAWAIEFEPNVNAQNLPYNWIASGDAAEYFVEDICQNQ